MLGELLAAAVQRQQEQDTIARAIGAAVSRQGGIIEVPFIEMAAVSGGLAIEVDKDKEVVILRVLSEEAMAKEQAMAESAFQEKH